jgi:protein involved in polysaccharide export with SLBB domain
MKQALTYLILPLLLVLGSGCSNLDLAGASVSDVTGFGNNTPDYVDAEPELLAKKRQERLAKMMVKWERQRQGLGDHDYMIGQDDILGVSIFALETPEAASEFSREVTKDGTIDLPLVGELRVVGLNAAQVKKAMKEAYGEKFIRNPRISVAIQEYKSLPVVIAGAVNAPGVYYLTHNSSSVLELLSMADGLTEEAGTELMIIRNLATDGSSDAPAAEEAAEDEDPVNYDFSVFNAADENAPRIASTTDPAVTPSPATEQPDHDDDQIDEKVSKAGGWGGLFGKKKKDGDAPKETPDTDTPPVATPGDENTLTVSPAKAAPSDPEKDAFGQESTVETIVIDLERLVDYGDLNHNVTITGGDLITIPTRKSEFVYVTGYVASPGSIEIEKGNRVRALWAIAQVGGLNSSARPQNCVLIRERAMKPIPVDLRSIARGSAPPLYMEPGDTLIVGSSRLMKIFEWVKPTASAGVSASPVP